MMRAGHPLAAAPPDALGFAISRQVHIMCAEALYVDTDLPPTGMQLVTRVSTNCGGLVTAAQMHCKLHV